MDDAATLTPSHLTNEEAMLVHNLETLGLPMKKACELAGVGVHVAYQSHVVQAREEARKRLRRRVDLTKDDVVEGMLDAIDRAKIIAEPATEIRGWEAISKLLGFDSPTRIDINLRESIAAVQQQVKALPTSTLVELLGAGNVIDGEFYEVKP